MKQPIYRILLLILLFSAGKAYAQLPVLPIIRDSIYSDILREERTLEIVLPFHYSAQEASKTGVIYVTDGEWNTGIVSSYNQFLNIQFIPANIVVGIDAVPKGKDNMRFRDMTPTKDPSFAETGGADKFLAFIKNELMPYINKKYSNNGDNTFFGASLGGLFGAYALLQSPETFNSYLLADPSLFWNNYMIQKMAAAKVSAFKGMSKTVLITGRAGKPFHGMGIYGLDSVMRSVPLENLHWKSLAYDDETHNSMIFRTMYDGLKFIYGGYFASNNLGFHPSNGYLLKDKPIRLYCFSDGFSDIRYTTDGTLPIKTSALLPDGPVSVSAGMLFIE